MSPGCCRTYEPLLVEVINELKDSSTATSSAVKHCCSGCAVRGDLQIIRRQIRALRYVRPFLQADARDFRGQAQIVAKMVRVRPFFVKLAQVAAATADFLPEEMARELMVFQEDVPPMSAAEARQPSSTASAARPSRSTSIRRRAAAEVGFHRLGLPGEEADGGRRRRTAGAGIKIAATTWTANSDGQGLDRPDAAVQPVLGAARQADAVPGR